MNFRKNTSRKVDIFMILAPDVVGFFLKGRLFILLMVLSYILNVILEKYLHFFSLKSVLSINFCRE